MRKLPVFLTILLVFILSFYLVTRVIGADDHYGDFVVFCPGPDHYGYVCDNGDTFAYIDADQDTQLYQDDGAVTINLPFSFTFYGETYEQVTASSNGNLQFGTSNANPFNECFAGNPIAGMGQMIAPYWDDLDLTFLGYLETTIVGEAPNRIFIIEWDEIPYFGDPNNFVTFEVQLFEKDNDIVFLYQTVDLGSHSNGRSATIGIQSEEQGLVLAFACNQPSVINTKGIHIIHPENPNAKIPNNIPILARTNTLPVKGEAAILLHYLQTQGEMGIVRYQQQLQTQHPSHLSQWQWLDVTGDEQSELVWLTRGTTKQSHLTRLTIIGKQQADDWQVLLDSPLGTRELPANYPTLTVPADATGDGSLDLLIQDTATGGLWFVQFEQGEPLLLSIPTTCTGRAGLVDIDQDGVSELVQNECPTNQRLQQKWDAGTFITIP